MTMTLKPNPFTRVGRSMLGMSLVEIMVATAVGLIGVTMIMQVYAVAEAQKRTTSGASDAQIAGNIALFSVERDLRYAGFSMVTNAGNMLGCNTHAYDSLRPANQDFTFEMAPVIITVGVGGASDTIKVVYGNTFSVIEGTLFSAGATADVDYPLKNAAGFRVGGLIVPFEAGQDCVVAEVTGFVPASVNTVQHAPGATYSYTDTSGNVVNGTAHMNKAGGLGSPVPTYTAAAKLYAIGRAPVVKTFKVVNDKLVSDAEMPYVAAQDADGDGISRAELGTGIVQIKAMYGKDTNGDRVVDTWNTTKPTNANEWMQVRAVKVAVLARSGLFEKTAVTGVAPTWRHPSTGAAISFVMANLADGTTWQNYRYRVYETTVPLRNLIWSNDP
jgi:type IV pilus assembly protein PilW